MKSQADLKKQVKELGRRALAQKLTIRWASNEIMPGAGEWKSPHRGSGDDFDGFDDYQPGDDTRDIDWNATALTGGQEVVLSRYREPRQIKAFIVCDVNKTMQFGTRRVSKHELAAELAATCVASVNKTRDRVGLLAFSEKRVEKILPVRTACNQMIPVLKGILTAQASAEGSGNGLSKALKQLPSSRSLVFLITDFLNWSETDWAMLKRTSRRHEIVCFYVQDQRERELPQVNWGWGPIGWLLGWIGCFYTLQDWTGAQKLVWVNKATQKSYAANFRNFQANVITRLKDAGCKRWAVVSTEEGDAARDKIRKLFRSST